MTLKALATATVAALCAAAPGLSAQTFGVGAHVATTGIGATVGVDLNNRIAAHGSIGVIPFEPEGTFSDLKFTVEPPSPLTTLGIDVFPGAGSFHLMVGMLFGAQNTTLTGEYAGEPVTIGDQTYQGDQVGTLIGNFETSNAAPFAGIGIGRHTGAGFGVTFDLGVAYMGEPTFTLNADGPISQNQEFRDNLEAERAAVQESLEQYAKFLPIIKLGFRIGL